MERQATSVATPARTTGSLSVVSCTDHADADSIRQQLITELLMLHGCYPSCTSAEIPSSVVLYQPKDSVLTVEA